jgi:hypothetical protein
MANNEPGVFDCPDPLTIKYKGTDEMGDLNAPYYCKVCDTWKRRARFSKVYAPENVCRNCAKDYAEGQRKVARALWEQYDKENQEK